MIKVEKKVVEAICDACKRSLVDAEEPGNTNYGLLRTHFGYGSRLDDLSDLHGYNDKHLCEDCWEKALASVGLIAKRTSKRCEHVWQEDGDRDVCKLCGTRSNPVI